MHATTVIEWFNEQVAILGDSPALRTKAEDGGWSVRTWADYGAEVRALARALAARGIAPGDHVATLSGNRAEYLIADLAIVANGAIPVPVYQTNAPVQVRYVLDHSGAKLVFCEDGEQLAKVAEVADTLPELRTVVTFTDGKADTTYATLVDEGRMLDAADPSVYRIACSKVTPHDVATLIYTSGTTGPPKAAMITHANVVWMASAVLQVVHPDPARFLSYLPLAHILERIVSHYVTIAIGGETWFGRGVPTLREDIQECRPTVFVGVPRVYEKFESAIKQRVAELDGLQGRLVRAAIGNGRRCVEAATAGRTPRLGDRVMRVFHQRVVLAKLRGQAGFGEAQLLISGAAPITTETLVFFHALGLPVAEGYGLTETTSGATLNPPERIRIGTVGPPLPGIDLRIAPDGEILIRGGCVFEGYYRDPEKSAEVLTDDGWFLSGDLGAIDPDGYLRITGRKKDLIITAGGKNISPQNIESGLKALDLVSQALVVGDSRPFLSALITLDADALLPWAQEQGLPEDLAVLVHNDAVNAAIGQAVDAVNANLSKVERVKRFRILEQDFRQEAGELTPTLKVRRHVVEATYAAEIDGMYA